MEITIKWTVDSKSDEEAKKKVKALLNTAYGDLVTPLPDWDPESLKAEIQELKLENDRLKQREEKMLHVIKSIACDYGDCEKCLFFKEKCLFFKSDNLPCGDVEDDYKVCVNLLNELEDL